MTDLFNPQLKVISLWQPWASLIFSPTQPKRHETRGWAYPSTLQRCRIGIHAALKQVPLTLLSAELLEICDDELGCSWRESVPRGAIIGTVELGNCEPMQRAIPADQDDRICGDWSPGRFAWELLRPRAIDGACLPWKGRQGWFSVPCDALPAGVLG